MSNMEVRKFQEGDAAELWNLYYDTIHNVNIQDYDNDQIARVIASESSAVKGR